MARFQEIPKPEKPRGTDAEKIEQLYRNQLRMQEAMQNIVNNLSKGGKDSNG